MTRQMVDWMLQKNGVSITPLRHTCFCYAAELSLLELLAIEANECTAYSHRILSKLNPTLVSRKSIFGSTSCRAGNNECGEKRTRQQRIKPAWRR